MASQAGGMEIEEVAAKNPKAIFKRPSIRLWVWRMAGAQARLARTFKPMQTTLPRVPAELVQSLHRNRRIAGGDQSLHHHKDDKLFALDAKITFDDNALFRHPEIRRYATTAERPAEVEPAIRR